jgi:hypothetical protein
MLLNKQLNQTLEHRAGAALAAVVATVASTGFVSAQTSFVIASANSGQVLDVPGFSTTPGTLIQQYPFDGGTNQQWTIRRVGSNYEIVSLNSGQVLDVPGLSTIPGTHIQQYPANGGTNQQWWFRRTNGSTGYEIISADYETINGGCDNANPPNCYFGQTVNLALDVPGFSITPGTRIQQYAENDGTNQQWLFYPQALRNISVSGNNNTVTTAGWGFQPGGIVCPLFNFSRYVVTGSSCATVLPNGTFNVDTTYLPGYYYDKAAIGNVVVTVEDTMGNVLAIGSAPGAWVAIIK